MIQELLQFIEKSTTCFHAVANLEVQLMEAGCIRLKEDTMWELQLGKSYYVVRNDSSILAFSIPDNEVKGFHIVASHSDSPCFKIKENPEIGVEEAYVKLNTERYGGMILSTWLDRPLSVAGRIFVEVNGKLKSKLVDLQQDLLVIPNIAIHLGRDMNKGVEYNAQTDMLPLFSGMDGKGTFLTKIAAAAGVEADAILGSDLYVYNREVGKVIGANEEFLLAPRLDDLECAFATCKGFLEARPKEYINVFAVFDNEEVGSHTKQGAASTFLKDTLIRITEKLYASDHLQERYQCLLADSFLLSADNAHAVHPNHTERYDLVNKPRLNAGVVLKHSGSQSYTTDAHSAAYVRAICKREKIALQDYVNRSDIAGGSTLGNVSSAQVSIAAADIGLPQFAMHSANETAGTKDLQELVALTRVFMNA